MRNQCQSFLFPYNETKPGDKPEACHYKVTHLTTEAHSCRMSTAVMSMFWCGQLSRRPSRGMPPALQMASLFLVPLQQLFSASSAHRATSVFIFFFVVRLARLGISFSTWTWGPETHNAVQPVLLREFWSKALDWFHFGNALLYCEENSNESNLNYGSDLPGCQCEPLEMCSSFIGSLKSKSIRTIELAGTRITSFTMPPCVLMILLACRNLATLAMVSAAKALSSLTESSSLTMLCRPLLLTISLRISLLWLILIRIFRDLIW